MKAVTIRNRNAFVEGHSMSFNLFSEIPELDIMLQMIACRDCAYNNYLKWYGGEDKRAETAWAESMACHELLYTAGATLALKYDMYTHAMVTNAQLLRDIHFTEDELASTKKALRKLYNEYKEVPEKGEVLKMLLPVFGMRK